MSTFSYDCSCKPTSTRIGYQKNEENNQFSVFAYANKMLFAIQPLSIDGSPWFQKTTHHCTRQRHHQQKSHKSAFSKI